MMSEKRYAYDEEMAFFVDMDQTSPDYPGLGMEMSIPEVLDRLNGIAALEAELEELRETIAPPTNADQANGRLIIALTEYRKFYDSLEAENARLREAIRGALSNELVSGLRVADKLEAALEEEQE